LDGAANRAATYFERALALRPSEDIRSSLSWAYHYSRQYDKEIALLETRIATSLRGRFLTYQSLADACLSANDPDKAIAIAQKIADNDSPDLAGKCFLSKTQAKAGRMDQANATYRAVREEMLRRPPARRNMNFVDFAAAEIGLQYAVHGDLAQSLDFLRSVRNELTDTGAVQMTDWVIAKVTARLPGSQEAPPTDGKNLIETLEAEAAENPNNLVPLFKLATAYRSNGERDKEAAVLRRLIAMDGSPKNRLSLIACLTALRDDKGTIEAYESMLAADPASAPGRAADYVSTAGRMDCSMPWPPNGRPC